MNTLESNIVHSFNKAKKDILYLQNQIAELNQKYEDLMKVVLDTRKNKETRIITKTVRAKTQKKTFVGSKEGKKFHITECPFAKNIKPKSKITFKTKDAALNKGYKPCECIN